MKTFFTHTFKRAAKKLHRNQVEELEKAIKEIQGEPLIGQLKVGDLAGVRVHKFRMLHQLILLAYMFDEGKEELTLLSFAPHENFYDNLKKQIHHY